MRENRILHAAAIVSLIGLTGCVQTVSNGPSANAPSECVSLAAEHARRGYAYNVKSQAIRENPAKRAQLCTEPNRLKERIAELSAIVAISDRMNAKGCYQQPIGQYNRNLIERLKATLAQCQTQAANAQR